MTGSKYLAAASVAFLVGCANNNPHNAASRANASAMSALQHDDSQFELAKDPPMSAQTRIAAAQLAECQNQWPRAIDQYSEALKLEPQNQVALYRLGVINTQLQHFPEAIEAWKRYVRATNGSAAGFSNLAFCYDVAKMPAEAELAYKQGIEREPANQSCRVNYGLMLARLGRREESVAELSVALQPAEVHYDLASLYEQTGKKDLARQEYQQALKLAPDMWEARSRLAKLD